MKKLFVLFILAMSMSGCLATKQYRAAESACTQKALQEFPVSIEMQLATCYKNIQVPTGQTTCTSNKSGTIDFGYLGTDINSRTRTNCTSLMTTERIPYSCTQRVDTNLQARKQAISACTTNSCFQMYGNAECEAPKGMQSSKSKSGYTSMGISGSSTKGIFTTPEQVVKNTNCKKPYYDFEQSDSFGSDRRFVYTCKNRGPVTVRCTGLGNFKENCALVK